MSEQARTCCQSVLSHALDRTDWTEKATSVPRSASAEGAVPGVHIADLCQKSSSVSTRVVNAAPRSPSQPPAALGSGRKRSWMAHCWKSRLHSKQRCLC